MNLRRTMWSRPACRKSSLRGRSRGVAALGAECLERRQLMAVAPLNQTFNLSSLPGASKTIYLDFTGHRTMGTRWNYTPPTPPATDWAEDDQQIICTPFTLDDSFDFNDQELTFIQDVWARVAEDYAPFQVNVTTREPLLDLSVPNPWRPLVTAPTFSNPVFVQNSSDLLNQGGNDIRWGVRVVISDGSRPGDENPATGGGVAWGDSFGGLTTPGGSQTTETPCFVDVDGTGAVAANVAEAASHEAGHTLGLEHDGMSGGGSSGNAAIDYYPGHGSGRTSWAPIMGAGYGRGVTQWSKGEYASANNPQDDLAVLSDLRGVGGFSYRPDDHSDTIARATRLAASAAPARQRGTGIIERNTDVDIFSFNVASGTVDLHVRPLDVISDTDFSGANLDVGAVLLAADGRVVAEMRPSNRVDARFTGTLTGGRYFVRVFGTGNGDPLVNGYSNYGSLGQYTVEVSQGPAQPGLPLVAVAGPGTIAEGTGRNTAASFVVTLSQASASAVTVAYATRDGSATVGDGDYTPAVGSITFAPGEVRKVVSVPVIGDARPEGDETFVLELTGASGASVGRAEAIATIRNDDRSVPRRPILAVIGPNGPVAEGAAAAFVLQLSEPVTQTVSVRYATSSGTATSGRDFTAATGVVTFQPGETIKVVSVATIDDTLGEGDETFAFVVTAPPSTVQVPNPRITATIAWSDGGPPRRSVLAAFAALESGVAAAARPRPRVVARPAG